MNPRQSLGQVSGKLGDLLCRTLPQVGGCLPRRMLFVVCNGVGIGNGIEVIEVLVTRLFVSEILPRSVQTRTAGPDHRFLLFRGVSRRANTQSSV